MATLTNKNFTCFIVLIPHSGAYRVDVWDDDDTMYPERFNTKFYGYNLEEVKNFIKAGLIDKYPESLYKIDIEYIVKNN